jgi:hypothetical protein
MRFDVSSSSTIFGADPAPAQGILIRVKNASELARSQGAVATFAEALAPATVGTKVLSTIASELKKALKEKNVDASIEVVDPAGWEPASGKFMQDLGFAVGGAGVLAGLWWLFVGRKHK